MDDIKPCADVVIPRAVLHGSTSRSCPRHSEGEVRLVYRGHAGQGERFAQV